MRLKLISQLIVISIYLFSASCSDILPEKKNGQTNQNGKTISANSMTLVTNEDTRAEGQLSAQGGAGLYTYSLKKAPIKGSVDIDPSGKFTYTPDANANGSDQFEFRAEEDSANAIGIVAISITPANDPPVAAPSTLTTDEDISATGNFAASDIDSALLSFRIVSQASMGTVLMLDPALGTFRYTPNSNVNGNDSFTFAVSDGSLESNESTVSIAINPVNDPPIATNGSFTLDEDTPASGTLSATDIESTLLTYSIVAQGTKGTVVFNSGPTGGFTYIPINNATGSDTFTFRASDGLLDSNTASISITVNPVNDPPVAQMLSLTTEQSTPISGQLLATDPDGTLGLSYKIGNQPSHGSISINPSSGAFTYAPEISYMATDSFTFRVTDPAGASATADVNIQIVSGLLFVSSQTFLGRLNGISGADTFCTNQAASVGLGGRTWRSIISDSTTSARDRIYSSGPIADIKGNLRALNSAQLFTSSSKAIYEGLTEVGTPITGRTWTGSTLYGRKNDLIGFDGLVAPHWQFSSFCNDWTKTDTNLVSTVRSNSSTGPSAPLLQCSLAARVACISFGVAPPLRRFGATPSLDAGKIDILVDLPEAIENYGRVEIKRVIGSSQDCNDANNLLLREITTFEKKYTTFKDSVAVGSSARYLACVKDKSGNVIHFSASPITESGGAQESKRHWIFVTASTYSWDMSTGSAPEGIPTADYYCTQAASSMLPGNSNSWVALLSDSTHAAKNAVAISAPVYNLSGNLVALDEEDLFDGSIGSILLAPFGGELIDQPVWTGSFADGTSFSPGFMFLRHNSMESSIGDVAYCDNWGASSQIRGAQYTWGIIGRTNSAASGAWLSSERVKCAENFPFATKARLYCISK